MSQGGKPLQFSPAYLLIDTCAIEAMPYTDNCPVNATAVVRRTNLTTVITQTVGSELFGREAFCPAAAGRSDSDGKRTIFQSYNPNTNQFTLKPWDQIEAGLKEPYGSDRKAFLERCKSGYAILSYPNSRVCITKTCDKRTFTSNSFHGYEGEQGELSIAEFAVSKPNARIAILTHDHGLALDIHNMKRPFPQNIAIMDINSLAAGAGLANRLTPQEEAALKAAVSKSPRRPPIDLFHSIDGISGLENTIKQLDESHKMLAQSIKIRDLEFQARKAAEALRNNGADATPVPDGHDPAAAMKANSVNQAKEKPEEVGVPGMPGNTDKKRRG